MAKQNHKKQLAQILNIPIKQLDRVINVVHQTYRQAIPYQALLELVKRNPDVRHQFQKIYKQIYSPEIQALAQIWDLSLPDTERVCQDISAQLPFPVTIQMIYQVVKQHDRPKWTFQQLLYLLKVNYAAERLHTSEAHIDHLRDHLKQLFQQTLTADDLLHYLEIETEPPDLQTATQFFTEEYLVATEIAQLLNISQAEAGQFVRQTRQTMQRPLLHDQTLPIIRQLSAKNRNLKVLAEVIDYQLIAQRFGLTLQATHQLILENETGSPNIRQQIVAALPALPSDATIALLKLVLLLAELFNLTPSEAYGSVQQIRQRVGATISPEAIADVVQRMKRTAVSEKNIITNLQTEVLSQQLALTPLELEQLLADLSNEIGAIVTPDHIFTSRLPIETLTIDGIRAHFWQIQHPVPQMAALMRMSAWDVPKLITQVQDKFKTAVSPNELLNILQTYPIEYEKGEQLIQALFARHVAAELEHKRANAFYLIAQIKAHSQRPDLSPEQIATALAALPQAEKNRANLENLLHLSHIWAMTENKVMTILQHVQKHKFAPAELTHLLQIAQQLAPDLRHEEGLACFLSLTNWLKYSKPKVQQLNDLALKIVAGGFYVKMKDIVEKNLNTDAIAVADIEHFLWLLGRLPRVKNLMSPHDHAGERWITQAYIDFVLAEVSLPIVEKCRQQSRKLTVYGQQCWQKICSDEREFQVPSAGRAEILVPDFVTKLVQLKSIRLIQEDAKAPGLFIQCKFANADVFGLIEIDPNGQITGFHQFISDPWFQAIIQSIALSHYRDLVVPIQRHYLAIQPSQQPARPHRTHATRKPSSFKPFPDSPPYQKQYKLSDWYQSQYIARYQVRGHTRWVRSHFVADAVKRQQAKSAGVTLVDGYTWVLEHERGTPWQTKIKLDGEDLTELTIFLPPPKAAGELRDIILEE